jgi:hypothetical protein
MATEAASPEMAAAAGVHGGEDERRESHAVKAVLGEAGRAERAAWGAAAA